MESIDLHIININGMLAQATEMLEQSYSDIAIDQSRYIGEKMALERVLRYLRNQKDLVVTHGVSLDESLALMSNTKKGN